ncbi:MAG: 5'-nucleotidase C-terminal domain-containing protein, partial [Emergencia timonensis]
YKLIPLDKKIKDDKSILALEDEFKDLVDEEYFSKFGYRWNSVLTNNDVTFTGIDIFGSEQGEDTLGNLIADSYIYGVKQAEGSDYEKVEVAVAPAGVIRGSFDKGKITAADAFNALSLGTGKDGIAGYPLVSVYLTGAELKLAAEIDISVSNLMQPARLYFSGLYYEYNPHRLILNRAYDVMLRSDDGSYIEPEDDKLYRVVADLYSAQMLGTVNSMSYGLLSVTPKDKDGNEIKNYEDYIIYNKNGSELKEWYALASYMDYFSDDQVPEKYSATEGRKKLNDSWNPIHLLKNPNKFFWIITAAAALVLSLLALIVILVVRLVRRIRYGKGTIRRKDMMFSRR